jgi:hypothetical protein
MNIFQKAEVEPCCGTDSVVGKTHTKIPRAKTCRGKIPSECEKRVSTFYAFFGKVVLALLPNIPARLMRDDMKLVLVLVGMALAGRFMDMPGPAISMSNCSFRHWSSCGQN